MPPVVCGAKNHKPSGVGERAGRDFPYPLLFPSGRFGRAICSFCFWAFEAEFAGRAGGWGGEEFGDGAGGTGSGRGVEIEERADVGFVCSGYWITLINEGHEETLLVP